MRHRKSAARVFIACMLTLCLIAGTLPFAEEANAASDYNTQTASPFSNAGKKLYTHNARFAGSLIVNGVDVSEWQHAGSKWNEAKAKGVDFAILRVSYTGTTSGKQYPDSNFAKFYTETGAAGVMRGVYVFSQAKTDEEAINEAIYAVNCLHGLGITPKDLELPVYMDYEFSGPSSGASAGRLYGISKEQAMSCAKVFCQVIRAYGYQPGIYANTSFFRNYLDNGAGLEPDVDLWCAQYYSRCESGANYSKWQYSSSAYIGDKGLAANVSGNVGLAINLARPRAKKKAEPVYVAPEPEPQPEPQPEPVVVPEPVPEPEPEPVIDLVQKSEEFTARIAGVTLFDFDRYNLRSEAFPVLDEIAQWLRENPERTMLIEGYTDQRGTDAYNKVLSQNRAEAVRNYLVKAGIAPHRITALGRGKGDFKIGHTTEEVHQQNRRTVITVK